MSISVSVYECVCVYLFLCVSVCQCLCPRVTLTTLPRLCTGHSRSADSPRPSGGQSLCVGPLAGQPRLSYLRQQVCFRGGSVLWRVLRIGHDRYSKHTEWRLYRSLGPRILKRCYCWTSVDHLQGIFMRWGHQGNRDRERGLEVQATLQTIKSLHVFRHFRTAPASLSTSWPAETT